MHVPRAMFGVGCWVMQAINLALKHSSSSARYRSPVGANHTTPGGGVHCGLFAPLTPSKQWRGKTSEKAQAVQKSHPDNGLPFTELTPRVVAKFGTPAGLLDAVPHLVEVT
jgi:hypothetical protein